MIALKEVMPNMPRLLMVKLPPAERQQNISVHDKSLHLMKAKKLKPAVGLVACTFPCVEGSVPV